MPAVRVALIDAHEIVVSGVSTLLSRYPDRIQFVKGHDGRAVDVILYGVGEETSDVHDDRLHALLRASPAAVVAFGWKPDAPWAVRAATCGVRVFASKQLSGDDLVELVEHVHLDRHQAADVALNGDCYPGVGAAGLTARETEMLTLIAQGYSNAEIARRLYLSINSVKTYIRSAYRKVGVTRRTQAVIWARHHGLVAPDGDRDPGASVAAHGTGAASSAVHDADAPTGPGRQVSSM